MIDLKSTCGNLQGFTKAMYKKLSYMVSSFMSQTLGTSQPCSPKVTMWIRVIDFTLFKNFDNAVLSNWAKRIGS